MSRTIVYIDGFNLFYSLRKTPYKWLDIKKLVYSVLDLSRNHIIKIKYFTARTPFFESTQGQDVYLRALKTLKEVEIVYDKFKRRDIRITKRSLEKLPVSKVDSDRLLRIYEIIGRNRCKYSDSYHV